MNIMQIIISIETSLLGSLLISQIPATMSKGAIAATAIAIVVSYLINQSM